MITLMRILSSVFIAASLLVIGSASYANEVEDDAALLARASAYLNKIDTLQARFLQIDGRGGVAEGDLYVDRPGKMRLA